MKLFFDTETTGKANMRGMLTDPSQPHIVQFGALLTEDDGTERGALDAIIKPNGWMIPKEASDIHGITTEDAERCGVQIGAALAIFSNMLAASNELIAHNIDFDLFVVRCALYRIQNQHKGAFACNERLDSMQMFCTMKSTTDICQLPGPYGFKWPKLTEAHKHFFGSDLEGAHDAMTDLRACKRIYFEINKPK